MGKLDLIFNRASLLQLSGFCGRAIEIYVHSDQRDIKGVLKGITIADTGVYVDLYNCQVTKDGETKKYDIVRSVPLHKSKYHFPDPPNL